MRPEDLEIHRGSYLLRSTEQAEQPGTRADQGHRHSSCGREGKDRRLSNARLDRVYPAGSPPYFGGPSEPTALRTVFLETSARFAAATCTQHPSTAAQRWGSAVAVSLIISPLAWRPISCSDGRQAGSAKTHSRDRARPSHTPTAAGSPADRSQSMASRRWVARPTGARSGRAGRCIPGGGAAWRRAWRAA
jgi:hypothetical protein